MYAGDEIYDDDDVSADQSAATASSIVGPKVYLRAAERTALAQLDGAVDAAGAPG